MQEEIMTNWQKPADRDEAAGGPAAERIIYD